MRHSRGQLEADSARRARRRALFTSLTLISLSDNVYSVVFLREPLATVASGAEPRGCGVHKHLPRILAQLYRKGIDFIQFRVRDTCHGFVTIQLITTRSQIKILQVQDQARGMCSKNVVVGARPIHYPLT